MQHKKIHVPDRILRDIITKAIRNTLQTLDSARRMGTSVSGRTPSRVQRGAPGAGSHSYRPAAPGAWGQWVWAPSLPHTLGGGAKQSNGPRLRENRTQALCIGTRGLPPSKEAAVLPGLGACPSKGREQVSRETHRFPNHLAVLAHVPSQPPSPQLVERGSPRGGPEAPQERKVTVPKCRGGSCAVRASRGLGSGGLLTY